MTTPLPDYHVHTHYSDGEGEVADCVERAIELGLPEIGFADHIVPASLGDLAYYSIRGDQIASYVADVRAAAARYPQIRVLLGAEADFVPGTELELAAILDEHAFDYVLGSVHYVDGFGFADDPDDERWADKDAVYRGYYRAVAKAAAFGRFDVISHLDYVKVWGYRPDADIAEVENAALGAISLSGAVLELNTSGLREMAREMYPSPGLLQRAHRLGIPITVGSDAHAPAEVGERFDQAADVARQVGYETIVRLSDRGTIALG